MTSLNFKCRKEKYGQPETLYPAKIFFLIEGKIKMFLDKRCDTFSQVDPQYNNTKESYSLWKQVIPSEP